MYFESLIAFWKGVECISKKENKCKWKKFWLNISLSYQVKKLE